MPLTSPAYPIGPYRFRNREYLIITYRTDPQKLRELVPEPLQLREPLVKFEFIRMPDSTGFGDYTESGQVIPVIVPGPQGQLHPLHVSQRPSADCRRTRAVGLSQEACRVRRSAPRSTPWWARSTTARSASRPARWATSTEPPILQSVKASLAEPNFLLKIIPHVDGTPRICELVEYHLEDVDLKGAWTGPASLNLWSHALAPVAELPVLEVVSAMHIVADLTLALGKVVHDYLAQPKPLHRKGRTYELAQ